MTDKDGNRVIKGKSTGHETELNLLVPYLPFLLFRYWDDSIALFILCIIYESRFYQEFHFTETYNALCAAIPKDFSDMANTETPIGTISIVSCPNVKNKSGKVLKIIDWTSQTPNNPAPLNRCLRMKNSAFGLTIYRDGILNSTVLTKGEGISPQLWIRISDALTELEGSTDSDFGGSIGAWHVTRNPNGIAGFLLNGNPTHRYVPPTRITAHSLARIVENCAENCVEN